VLYYITSVLCLLGASASPHPLNLYEQNQQKDLVSITQQYAYDYYSLQLLNNVFFLINVVEIILKENLKCNHCFLKEEFKQL